MLNAVADWLIFIERKCVLLRKLRQKADLSSGVL